MPILPYTGTAPTRAYRDDAGLDLYAAEDVTLDPGESHPVPTGTRLALPAGTVGLVCPRSGLAAHRGVTVLNSPGIVDAGYRGEVLVNLVNHGTIPVTIFAGGRIAQLVIVPIVHTDPVAVESLDGTDRGDRGHGSTGMGEVSR